MKYFKYLPKIEYSSKLHTNIIVRAKIRDIVKKNAVALYPYIVKEGERPDIIAHKYYGTSDYTWLVFYSNDMYDPIFDWVLTYDDFIKFIISKYGSIETAHQTTSLYYDKTNNLIIDYTTYLSLPENERGSLSVYDHENMINEKKRNIFLIDNDFATQATEEIKSLFR